MTLISARERLLKQKNLQDPSLDDDYIKSKMIAYTSDQSNSAVEKAGRIASMKMRMLESDANCEFRGQTLKAAFDKDIANGFYPAYVI